MKFQTLLPVITLVLGWLLNEFGKVLLVRKDEFKNHNRILADLLEIRHEVRGSSLLINELVKRVGFPKENEQALRELLNKLVPREAGLTARYNDSINLVAQSDPILAFRLRSKDQFGKYWENVKSLTENEEVDRELLFEMEKLTATKFVTAIDELILDVASSKGWFTRLKFKHYLARPVDISEEIDELLNFIADQEAAVGKIIDNKGSSEK